MTSHLDGELRAAIVAVPAFAGRRIGGVNRLEAGITNRNWRVEVDDEAFVVQLAGRDTALLGIDREGQLEAARAAAAAGVGPEVIAYLPHHGCFVTRFVQGEPIAEEDLQSDDVLTLVVRSVRAIHGCSPIRSTFPVFRIVEDYRGIAATRGVSIPSAYDEAHAYATLIEAAFADHPMAPTMCHDDLLNANFLRDGDHVWIVDYEYAGMGDPFFDLANLSVNNGLRPEAQEALLRCYFGTVRDVHRARLGLTRVMSDFREAMWGVVQQVISTLEFDYVQYAERHFARLLATASDDRFDDWLISAREAV